MSGLSSSAAPSDSVSVADDAATKDDAESGARVFYGWWIVAITFTGTFFATGIHDTVFSVLIKPISRDLHVSLTAISVPISLSIALGAILSPFVGRLMDKRGPRALSAGGA